MVTLSSGRRIFSAPTMIETSRLNRGSVQNFNCLILLFACPLVFRTGVTLQRSKNLVK